MHSDAVLLIGDETKGSLSIMGETKLTKPCCGNVK